VLPPIKKVTNPITMAEELAKRARSFIYLIFPISYLLATV
jgi:hypothetical protein